MSRPDRSTRTSTRAARKNSGKKHGLAREEPNRETRRAAVQNDAGSLNLAVPVGLAAAGVLYARPKGNVVPALLGSLGMTLIGTASLWRAYRTTVGMYQGQSDEPKVRPRQRQSRQRPAEHEHRQVARPPAGKHVCREFPSRSSRDCAGAAFGRSCDRPRRR